MKEILDNHLFEEAVSRSRWFYLFLALLLVGSVISTGLAWYEVESIVGSGPTMSIIGCILSIFAYYDKTKSLIWLGLIPFVISLFWWFAIEIYNLSPSDCKVNIPTSLSIATAFMLLLGTKYFLDKK